MEQIELYYIYHSGCASESFLLKSKISQKSNAISWLESWS